MKLLYITPKINDEGGVQKVLSVRTNYFIEKFGYEISILTQNGGNVDTFFSFNSKIELYDMNLKGNKFNILFQYKKQVLNSIKKVNPDIIVVCDFGLKGFLIPLLLKSSVPIVFEAHGSLYNESQYYSSNFFTNFSHSLKYSYRKFCAKKFDYFVALSKESQAEWNLKNIAVIPNPIAIENLKHSTVSNKKVVMVARHSYEKGIDRILEIWKKVIEKQSDWQLEIFGKNNDDLAVKKQIAKLNLEKNILLSEPVKDLNVIYSNASIYVMTSRSEGFPMVLLEAMSFGLPVVAFDCPIGPRAIVTNNENGFLIKDGAIEEFTSKLLQLMNDEDLRQKMSENAKSIKEKYAIDSIMEKWNLLFKSLKR